MGMSPPPPDRIEKRSRTSQFAIWIVAVIFALGLRVHADVPDQGDSNFSGMYKVASSNDPFFPIQSQQEYFVDFGDGTRHGKFSGKVAVSLRQNPNIKVRLMVWQYFPKEGNIRLGHQTHEGSKSAVVAADWQLQATTAGVLLERGNHQVLLRRADPKDY
jgi:hypothetical protein